MKVSNLFLNELIELAETTWSDWNDIFKISKLRHLILPSILQINLFFMPIILIVFTIRNAWV
jgi:hypothetical protein